MDIGKQRQQISKLLGKTSFLSLLRISFTLDTSPATVLVSTPLISLQITLNPLGKANEWCRLFGSSHGGHPWSLPATHPCHINPIPLVSFSLPKYCPVGCYITAWTKFSPESSTELLYQSSLSHTIN